jgi:hypothetical protein
MKWAPGKSRARLVTGAREDLNCEREYHRCSHTSTVTLATPHGHAHYSAERCALCGAFLCWVPKPATIERQPFNAMRLARLAMCEALTNWERGFVASVSQRKKVSPKQQEIIDRLSVTYLGAKP